MAGRKKQGAELSAPEIIENQTPEVEPEEPKAEQSVSEVMEEQVPKAEQSVSEVMEEQVPKTDEPKQTVISAPNKNFHGVIGGISFISGKAVLTLNGDSKTDRMLAWFRENGYSVVVSQAVRK